MSFIISNEIRYIETYRSKNIKLSAIKDLVHWYNKRNPSQVLTVPDTTFPTEVNAVISLNEYGNDLHLVLSLLSSVRSVDAKCFQRKAEEIIN